VTYTASPNPVNTASGLNGSAGTSTSAMRADAVIPMPDSGVTATSYTNANITVNAKGLITAASSGTNIPAGFALYVDKKGTDSASCGPLNAPCLTIDGAQDIIATNNDNGFATCSTDNSLGCGRCCSDSACAATTTCNENADCSGTSAQCVATVCQSGANSGKQCRSSADCAGGATCSTGATAATACTTGVCTGPNKAYSIHIGVGDYYEQVTPPAPGFVAYLGETQGLTRILDTSSTGTMVVTNRSNIATQNITLTNLGTGAALYSAGGTTLNGYYNTGFVFTGTDATTSWGINFTGTGNATNSFFDPLVFAYGASGNGVHFQSYPSGVCATDSTRACDGNADCATTCTLGTQSADFYLNGGQIQGGAGSGTLVWFEGKACGSNFNQVLDRVSMSGSNAGTSVGLKLSQTDCHASSDPTLFARRMRVIARDLKIGGTDIAGLTDFDTSVSVDTHGTLAVLGPVTYDACTRSLGDTSSIKYMSSTEYSGGPSDLGVLNCTAPSTPIDGECWYDAATDTRRECRVNGSTVGMLTTANTTAYNYQSCNLTEASDCVTGLSSTPQTVLTDSTTWDNTGKTTQIEGQVEVRATAARTITCKLKNNGSRVQSRSMQVDGSTDRGVIALHYIDTTSGTRGPYTLTCETDSGTANGTVTSGSMLRTTTDVPALATASSQIAGWLSDETGSGALVFGTSPTLTDPTINAGGGTLVIPNSTSSGSTTTGRVSMDTDSANDLVTVGDGTTAKPMRTCWREYAVGTQATSTTAYWMPGGTSPAAGLAFRELNKGYLGKKATFSNLSLVNRVDLANSKTMTCTLETADSSCDPGSDGGDTSCSWSTSLTASLTGASTKTQYKTLDTSSVSLDETSFYQFKVVTPDTGSFYFQCGVTVCIDEEF